MARLPNLSIEKTYTGVIAGIDEVGRGCWAGPVVAAAVVLPASKIPRGIDDSKNLTREARDELFTKLIERATYATGVASVEEIDTFNILGAVKLAMQRAYHALVWNIDVVLIDGNQPPDLPCQKIVPIVGGDGKSLSIAAASIIAKVTRDRMMEELAREYPHYGWESNVGYGTKCHQRALAEHGVCPHHRRSFAPIRAIVEAA